MGDFFDSKPSQQTSTYKPSAQQQQLLNLAMPYLQQFGKTGLQAYNGNTVAGFDPAQLQAQEMALSTALGPQTGLAAKGAGTANFLLGDVLNPESNPALQSYMTGATKQITDNFLQNILPEIRGEAITTGNFSGSGRGIAEGLAAQGAAQQVGQTQAGIANTAYGQGLGALQSTLGQLPQIQASQLAPASTVSSVGDTRQGYAQTILDALRSQFNQEQLLPYSTGSMLINALQGLPGGTSVTSASGGGSSPLQSVLGIGAILAGL